MEQDKKIEYYKKIALKILIVLISAVGIYLAYQVAMFYIPFLVAIIIATLLEPIIKFFMNKCKMKRKLASTIALILLVIIIGTFLTLLISKVISESTNLLANLNVYMKEAYDWGMSIFRDIQEGRIQISQDMMNLFQNSLSGLLEGAKGIITHVLTGIVNTVTSIPTMITYGFITILAIIFTCFDREYVLNSIRKHIPSVWLEKVKQIIKETCSVGWNYIKAEAKLSCICFFWVLIGLTVMNFFLDIRYPIIMSIFIGFVDLLPLFGAGAIMVPWALYLLLTGNIPVAIGVIGLWLVWAVMKQILEPKMVSKQMGLNPIFTLFGMYTGFRIFGVLGLILGPIILIILKNIFKELFDKGVLKSFFELE